MSPYPKKIKDVIEIMVENSESFYLNIHADCQEAFCYIDRTDISPKDIFVSIPIKFNDNIFRLVNPSNLPITFSWENKCIADEIIAEFSPSKGIIPPRSSKEIRYNISFFSSI